MFLLVAQFAGAFNSFCAFISAKNDYTKGGKENVHMLKDFRFQTAKGSKY